MRQSEPDDATHPVAVALWVDEHDVPIEAPLDADGPELGDVLATVGAWVAERVDDAPELKAAAGPRLGPAQERSKRSGSVEEVCAPVPIRPRIAHQAIRQRDVFNDVRRIIDIDVDSFENQGNWCSWLASVRTGPLRRRDATLRIGPSPSGNLTVLQLMPQETRRIYTRAFVRAGVQAVDEIGRSLSRACSPLYNVSASA